MFHVTSYAGQGTFFTAINYAYEELGKLICLVIKLSKFHFFCSLALLLFAFSIVWQLSKLPFSALSFANIKISLLLFQNPWHSVELIFSASSLAYIKTRFCFFLISTADFEKATSYFSTSNPDFSQAYVLRVQFIFFP